jgi:hypothetical protein
MDAAMVGALTQTAHGGAAELHGCSHGRSTSGGDLLMPCVAGPGAKIQNTIDKRGLRIDFTIIEGPKCKITVTYLRTYLRSLVY